MQRSTVLGCAALCLLVFASIALLDGKARLLPYFIAQAFAAGFAAYHLLKYRPKRKAVVFFIFVAECCYSLASLLAYLDGNIPSALDNAVVVLHYCGIGAMAATACAMLAIRRPFHYQEGVLDFAVAVVALATLQWELHGRNGAAVASVLGDFILPLFCVAVFATAIAITVRLFREKGQNRAVIAAQVTAVVLCGLGNLGFGVYGESNMAGEPMTHPWIGGLVITGGFLLCLTLVHRDSPALFRPEEGFGTRLSVMRWLGPAAALVTNPAMMGLLLYRGLVPSAPLTVCSVALTVLVVWRIHRLLADREAARRRSEMSEVRLQFLVQYAADVIVVTRDGGEITYISPGVYDMIGVTAGEAVGRRIQSFVSGPDVRALQEAMSGARTGPISYDVALETADGAVRWASIKATDHRNDSSVQGWVWNVHDITDRKLSEEVMSRLAMYDQLTGLPNRTHLRDHLERCLRDGEQTGPVAVLFCDLDGFKDVNDVLGHEAGDEVLTTVAGRWSSKLRATDVLGRWGGDEFVVICSGIGGVEPAVEVAARLAASLEEPLTLHKGEARVGASIGIVMGQPGEDVEALLRRADAAMYVAKRESVHLHIA